MNNVIIDDFGDAIPQDIEDIITRHIRRERKSPRLGQEQKSQIKDDIKMVWDSGENIVGDLVKPPLFPVRHPDISEGRDGFWSTLPLSRDIEYTHRLSAPKTDRHYGFHLTGSKSKWTKKQLSAADHPRVRSYSQPTSANLFPLFLVELKSELTGGTLYAAETQLANAGAHRVNSMIWALDQINPSRIRSNTDAVVFSAAVSQRETVVHVHYFNKEKQQFFMSFVNCFPFAKIAAYQECRDCIRNIIEWMVDVQQQVVQDVLDKLHPTTLNWGYWKSKASSLVEGNESIGSEHSQGPSRGIKGQPTRSFS